MARRRARWTTGVAVVLLWASGCGGGSARTGGGGAVGSSGGGGGGATLSTTDIAASLRTAQCAALKRCLPEVVATDADCTQLLASSTTFDSPEAIQAEAQAGKIQFNAASAQRCLDTLGTESCNAVLAGDPLGSDPDCQQAFAGQVTQGGTCIASLACQQGFFCLQSAPDSCQGTCQQSGVRCNFDFNCNAGSVCDATSHSCRAANPPAGAQGAGCGENDSCQAGLDCFHDPKTNTSSCVQPKDLGANEQCDFVNHATGFCTGGLSCVPDASLQTGTCLPVKGRGESCTEALQCGKIVGGTLICDPQTKVCVDRPSTGPCPAGGLGCNGSTSFCGTDPATGQQACIPFLGAGQPCQDSIECSGNGSLVCSTQTTTCAPPAQPQVCQP